MVAALSVVLGMIALAAGADLLPLWLMWPAVVGLVVLPVSIALTLRADVARIVTSIGRVADGDAPTVPGPLPLLAPVADALPRLIRRLAEREEAETRRQRANATILDRLPDPLIVLNTLREVQWSNQAAIRSFGQDMPAVLRHPALRTAIDRALAGEAQEDVAVTLSVPVPREARATLIPLNLETDGRIVVVLSDRTRDMAVERMRADFVANVSHELRTPLTSLVGFTETLLGPAADDPPARERFLGIMAEQGARMSRLIDDLLSLSRIELVEHQPPTDPIDLDRLTAQVLTFYGPKLAERRARIVTEIEPGLPMVPGDSDQLVQVLQNLLDNALKYGREGGIVRLTARRTTEPRDGVAITVADEGAGIPAEHLPRLTERFYRVDRARSRSAGGTGLGLAIVKHIVNRHRGQLQIESTEGIGTTVSVWLPFRTHSPEVMASSSRGPAEAVPG
jgi:two-component system phosphate regulon sensor histidine kinase PhoR